MTNYFHYLLLSGFLLMIFGLFFYQKNRKIALIIISSVLLLLFGVWMIISNAIEKHAVFTALAIMLPIVMLIFFIKGMNKKSVLFFIFLEILVLAGRHVTNYYGFEKEYLILSSTSANDEYKIEVYQKGLNPDFESVPVIFKDNYDHKFSLNDGPFTKDLYDDNDISIVWIENDRAEITIDEGNLRMYGRVKHIFYTDGEFKLSK